MQLNISPKLSSMTKHWLFWLLIVTGIAIILRSLPAWANAAWGCDFGIYYGLTNSFVENGQLFNTYYGWGGSYQYFPVLYAITGFSHWVTGIDVVVIMPKIAPIFGGLSVLIFYFVVRELIGSRKIALLSSLFLAVLPFHVYQTSHASPLTMGHFFMMLSMYLFIKYRQDNKYIAPLLISTGLLIMSHHLTTYFYVISLAFIIFVENASKKEWTITVKQDIVYIVMASSLVFSYWAFIATPVYESFMNIGLRIGPILIGSNVVVMLFYALFFSSFGVVWLKRKSNLFLKREEPTFKSCMIRFLVTLSICLTAMGIFSVVKMPWTNFSFTPLSILYSIPLLLMLGFGVAGFRYTRFIPNGFLIRGWLLAIILSFIYGLVTNNSGGLYPHRHLEYLMVPLSIIAVYGIRGVFLNFHYESLSKWGRRILHNHMLVVGTSGRRVIHKRQLIYAVAIVMLVTTNAASVYPSHTALNASHEAITKENLSVIEWMEENLDKNTSVIASDHRLARMAEAVGFNTTLDEASLLWDAENLSEYIDDLRGTGKNYSRITNIVIDDIMKDKVVHVGFGQIIYMTNDTSQVAYEKFSRQPFELIYRNTTINENMDELHWTEVYEVNWTYILNMQQ